MKEFFEKLEHTLVQSKVVTRNNAALTEKVGDNCSWMK